MCLEIFHSEIVTYWCTGFVELANIVGHTVPFPITMLEYIRKCLTFRALIIIDGNCMNL